MGTADEERRSSHADAGPRPYEAKRPDGTPKPLTPEMLTLSMLPRTQWHNLAHLDAIKVISFGQTMFIMRCAAFHWKSMPGTDHMSFQFLTF